MAANGDLNLVASSPIGLDPAFETYEATTCTVAESLVLLLEELTAQYKDLDTHPPHVVNSELYIIHILADCFSAHWDAANRVPKFQTKNVDQHS
ncbi:hypothetical protein V498_09970, partial [Pseudogymnoascus sp. VKM F-4517 (FW-2822)]